MVFLQKIILIWFIIFFPKKKSDQKASRTRLVSFRIKIRTIELPLTSPREATLSRCLFGTRSRVPLLG